MTAGRANKTFLADPASARAARQLVASCLDPRASEALANRVQLAVSELVANAVLHTAKPFTVVVDITADIVRLEVIDSAPDRLAVRVPTVGSAVDITAASPTGRGLQIVSALANRWGITVDPNVKSVWCEFDNATPDGPSAPVIDDHRPAVPRAADALHFVFLGAPVRAAIASGMDVDDMIRDVLEHRGGNDPDTARFLSLVDRSAPVRLAGRHSAMEAASRNELFFDMEIYGNPDAFAALLDLNEVLGRRNFVGGRSPSDEVLAFRAWVVEEAARQGQGLEPVPYGMATPVVVTSGDDWLWDHASCGHFVATADGRLVRMNPVLRRWLGATDEAVAGQPLHKFLTDGAQRAVDELLRLVMGGSPQTDTPIAFVRSDGSTFQARVSANSADGAMHAVVAGPEESEGRAAELIRALQQTLIPAAPAVVPGLEVAVAYHPALGEVGGDFFDVFEVAEGDWCVVLGDVSGKGVEAAIVTADARHAVRSSALREPVPSGLMRALNRSLCEKGGSRFCTVALLRLQLVHDSWVATLTSGGHPFPLLIRHGTATKLGRPGSLVGVFDTVDFHDVSIKLTAGDSLVFFTDGVTEARNAAGDFYGDERMCAALIGATESAQSMVDALVASVDEFQVGRSDDIALVVVRRPQL